MSAAVCDAASKWRDVCELHGLPQLPRFRMFYTHFSVYSDYCGRTCINDVLVTERVNMGNVRIWYYITKNRYENDRSSEDVLSKSVAQCSNAKNNNNNKKRLVIEPAAEKTW